MNLCRLQQQSTIDIQSADLAASSVTTASTSVPQSTSTIGKTATSSLPIMPVSAASMASTTTNNINRKINGFLNLKTPLIG